jgi:chemotaxis protein MotB
VRIARCALVAVAALSSGCLVSRRDLDACTAGAAQAKTAADARAADDDAKLADLQKELNITKAAVQARDGRLDDLSTATHNMQAQLDEQTAINQELRAALERMGKDADKLLAERGTLSKALDDAKGRLEELRRAQAAADARTALFRDFAQRFKTLIDAGQMRIESRRGQLVMELSGDLLFDPGHAEVKPVGKGALMEVAHALTSSPAPSSSTARRFLVTAHMDDEAVQGHHFKNAWHLTTARAAAVVDLLVSLGVAPETLTAAGAGSWDPLAPNDSADHRTRNRRVEIALLPSADETLPVPATK